ncbi:MAG: YqaE/Pmp3 family membrane protein [Proteobacteria bacterium]|nr:YqaE/Pmp3 family membrane protein [Pseudomonadota bacterium]
MDNKIVLTIIAILLPPVAAFLKVGVDKHLFINIVLSLFGYVPGIIHALADTSPRLSPAD